MQGEPHELLAVLEGHLDRVGAPSPQVVGLDLLAVAPPPVAREGADHVERLELLEGHLHQRPEIHGDMTHGAAGVQVQAGALHHAPIAIVCNDMHGTLTVRVWSDGPSVAFLA